MTKGSWVWVVLGVVAFLVFVGYWSGMWAACEEEGGVMVRGAGLDYYQCVEPHGPR